MPEDVAQPAGWCLADVDVVGAALLRIAQMRRDEVSPVCEVLRLEILLAAAVRRALVLQHLVGSDIEDGGGSRHVDGPLIRLSVGEFPLLPVLGQPGSNVLGGHAHPTGILFRQRRAAAIPTADGLPGVDQVREVVGEDEVAGVDARA
jgi:hypothetical protein